MPGSVTAGSTADDGGRRRSRARAVAGALGGDRISRRHAVVAAGSVVRGDVAPLTMVAGVPARFVRRIEPA